MPSRPCNAIENEIIQSGHSPRACGCEHEHFWIDVAGDWMAPARQRFYRHGRPSSQGNDGLIMDFESVQRRRKERMH